MREVGGRKESTRLIKDNLKQKVGGGGSRSPELLCGKNTMGEAGVRWAECLGNRLSLGFLNSEDGTERFFPKRRYEITTTRRIRTQKSAGLSYFAAAHTYSSCLLLEARKTHKYIEWTQFVISCVRRSRTTRL